MADRVDSMIQQFKKSITFTKHFLQFLKKD